MALEDSFDRHEYEIVAARLQEAEAACSFGNFQEAFENFEELFEWIPNQDPRYLRLIWLYQKAGEILIEEAFSRQDYETGQDLCKNLLARNPHNFTANYFLAHLYCDLGDCRHAYEHFYEALAYAPASGYYRDLSDLKQRIDAHYYEPEFTFTVGFISSKVRLPDTFFVPFSHLPLEQKIVRSSGWTVPPGHKLSVPHYALS